MAVAWAQPIEICPCRVNTSVHMGSSLLHFLSLIHTFIRTLKAPSGLIFSGHFSWDLHLCAPSQEPHGGWAILWASGDQWHPRLLLSFCLPVPHPAGTCSPPPACLLVTGLVVGHVLARSPALQAVGCCGTMSASGRALIVGHGHSQLPGCLPLWRSLGLAALWQCWWSNLL